MPLTSSKEYAFCRIKRVSSTSKLIWMATIVYALSHSIRFYWAHSQYNTAPPPTEAELLFASYHHHKQHHHHHHHKQPMTTTTKQQRRRIPAALPKMTSSFYQKIQTAAAVATAAQNCQEESMFQERDPFRIPGYIQGCHNTTYFGYVMRDFANRMFFRAVGDDSKSIVLVVAPGANQTLQELQQLQQQQNLQQPNLYKHYQYNVGKSMLIASLQNGHQVYAVDGRDKTNNTTTVDYWWETTFPPILSSEQPATTPSIWLTVFDPTSIGQEDMLVQGASNFLETASSKYIIFRVSSQLSSPGYHMNGLDAAELLWNAGYSLQILSASHSSQY